MTRCLFLLGERQSALMAGVRIILFDRISLIDCIKNECENNSRRNIKFDFAEFL